MMLTWPDPTPTPAPAAQAALRRMAASVAVATGLAASGRQIDLSGLDTAAGMLCAQILDLCPSESAALKPSLSELGSGVATLIGMLQQRTAQ